MPFVALIIGAIIIVAAFNGTHRDLATELESDLPGFFKWAVAIVAILALGFIPGMKAPSRMLFALVAIVLVVTQGDKIIAGIKTFAAGSGQPSAPAPAATGGGGSTSPATTAADPLNAITDFSHLINPLDLLTGFAAVAG